MNGYRLKAFRVNHNVLCYGYTLEIDRAGNLTRQKAKAPEYSASVLEQAPERRDDWRRKEEVFTPDMVLGPPRKGI